ncbi:hypothetical protein [Desulfatibacillum aliphaticivorans]|uniref:CopG family transcriptional regulator n=1 Tax=Desulfatibacillum aliphaticivorans TaxID=218208 RepID=B8FMM9_DESAL|nr:hypothetical protein [Desulfatibacillum aliphaticivorans]ACL01896.1 hypothetical protein Dalk_0187 [Desulfatibacillum aliphaticivorans]
MPKITIDPLVYSEAKWAAESLGYSSLEEFVHHVIEKELSKLASPEEDAAIDRRLKGLGYIK